MNVQRQTAQRLADNLQALGLDEIRLDALSTALEDIRRANSVSDATVYEAIDWNHFPSKSRKATRTILTNWGIVTNGLLQLVSEAEFSQLPEIGSDRLGRARSYLIDRGWSFRPDAMPFVTRAYELYGNVAAVPVSSLLVRLFRRAAFVLHEERIVARLVEEGMLTLGDVHDRSRQFTNFCGLVGGEEPARWLQGHLAAMF